MSCQNAPTTLAHDPLCDLFGQRGAVDSNLVFLADGHVEAGEQERGVVGVVIGVMVGEEEMVDVRGLESSAVHLVGGRETAVEHHPLPADLDQE